MTNCKTEGAIEEVERLLKETNMNKAHLEHRLQQLKDDPSNRLKEAIEKTGYQTVLNIDHKTNGFIVDVVPRGLFGSDSTRRAVDAGFNLVAFDPKQGIGCNPPYVRIWFDEK